LVYWSIGLTVLVIVTILIYFIRKYGLRNDGTANGISFKLIAKFKTTKYTKCLPFLQEDIKKSPINEDPELLAKLNATSENSKPLK
jgi:hypothetical protein